MNLINVGKNGNDIPVRIYKDEKGKYSIAISKKVGDEYKNKYFPVEFLKDVSLENGTDIIIKHAFMTWFDWEFDGKTGTKFIIKITAFEELHEPDRRTEEAWGPESTWGSAKSIEINDDDSLPFY